jgi:hypothetical protein
MTEDEAFLCQAQSDWALFERLLDADGDLVPVCHPLHYLQMATEKLSKAVLMAARQPPKRNVHDTFSVLLARLGQAEGTLALTLGWSDLAEFREYVARLEPLCSEVERLNPAVQRQHGMMEGGRNVEYPWRENASFAAPANEDFGDLNLRDRRTSAEAKAVVEFVSRLFDYYPEVVQQLPRP